jgi:Protein of unknown function (DUF2510)/DnaJ C terminal domain
VSDGLLAHGPARILTEALQQLHKRAGKPAVEDLCSQARLSEEAAQAALDGREIPDWAVVDTLVRALKGNVKGFRGLFSITQEYIRLNASGGQTKKGPDSSCEVYIHPAWKNVGLETQITTPGWVACDTCTSPDHDNEEAWKPGDVTCTTCKDTGTTFGACKRLVQFTKDALRADKRLHVPGMGETTGPDATPGDLYIRVILSKTATQPVIKPGNESSGERDFWDIGGPPGQNLAHFEQVSWRHATWGGTLRVSFEEKVRCATCSGVGILSDALCEECDGDGIKMGWRAVDVSIPKGVSTGNWLPIPGQGRPGARDGQPGDLHIIVNVASPRGEKARKGADRARDAWRGVEPKLRSTAHWLWDHRHEVVTATSALIGFAARMKSRSNAKGGPASTTSQRTTTTPQPPPKPSTTHTTPKPRHVPGWYSDPHHPGLRRWWNGNAWTHHTK